jgi:hypothetical protein
MVRLLWNVPSFGAPAARRLIFICSRGAVTNTSRWIFLWLRHLITRYHSKLLGQSIGWRSLSKPLKKHGVPTPRISDHLRPRHSWGCLFLRRQQLRCAQPAQPAQPLTLLTFQSRVFGANVNFPWPQSPDGTSTLKSLDRLLKSLDRLGRCLICRNQELCRVYRLAIQRQVMKS